MPAPTSASLTFLPWVRQGVAAAIATVDTLGAGQPGIVALNAALTVNGTPTPAVAVRLRGPADVVGIDANQVVRMDPPPGTSDFEPTYFPCVEFDRPDFPWLFTPASADPNAKLRPWLCLVVARQQNGVSLGSTVNAPLPVLRIAAPADPNSELPDLAECWAWAHAQTASADSTQPNVLAALEGPPELALSRLLCPRILAPDTGYIACVVPTFELGRKAGLGLPIADSDLIAANALAPAWVLSPTLAQAVLPVYHHWEFRTGAGGDFASLVSRLRPYPPPAELGRRPIDSNTPGFMIPAEAKLPPGAALKVEGALRPVPPANVPDVMPDWPESAAKPFQDALAAIVNAPGQAEAVDPKADPLLAPPLYGRWYAARPTVARTAADWFDRLNLDPRLRSVAAFGTHVVQQHQEALMASAWEQAGELQRANQRMRQLQVSLAVGDRLFARHFAPLSDEAALRVNGPVLSRIAPTAGSRRSMLAQIRLNGIPVPALSPAMRRMGRQRGPLTRRAAAQGAPRTATWVASLESGAAALPVPTWFDLVTVTAVSQHMNPPGAVLPYGAVTAQAVANRGGAPWFVVRPEGQPVPIAYSFTYGTPAFDSPSAAVFRRAAAEHLGRIRPDRGAGVINAHVPPVPMNDIRTGLTQGTQPRQSIAALAQGAISVGGVARQQLRRGAARAEVASDSGIEIDTVMLAPKFPQPMYEPLRDLSQSLMLPGLDGIASDSVLGLETNRRFIEAYMVGLNFEMGRELLWRGFPTDQRGTYFDSFWGGGDDIDPLHLWGERPLGDASGLPAREKFVMLLRSPLLRRYPNALVYLTPAVVNAGVRAPSEDPETEKLPVFAGSMPPDINFMGFDIPADQVVTGGVGGYYLVIQQHPTEPRFGLHTGVSAGNASHLSIGAGPPAGQPLNGLQWGLNAAHMAGITRRLPVRLAIHASQFLTPTEAGRHP